MNARRGRLAGVVLAVGLLAAWQPQPEPRGTFDAAQWNAGIDCHVVSGPFTHGNLTIFLLHGPDMHPGLFATLHEALTNQWAVVHETGNVNQLTVENNSPELDIFLQAGDIVKGGRQDRVLGADLIVSARGGKAPVAVPIEAFCVEHGRWSRRGGEDASKFGSAGFQGGGKEFKKAVQLDKSQEKVWQEVAANQRALMMRVGGQVQAAQSPTSFQLTLENKQFQEAAEKYLKDLGKIAEGKADTLGFVYAVNGQLSGAEVYGSHRLFEKLWPKLLQAAVFEAITELPRPAAPAAPGQQAGDEPPQQKQPQGLAQPQRPAPQQPAVPPPPPAGATPARPTEPATVDNVKAFLNAAAKGKADPEKKVGPRAKVITKTTERYALIETRDADRKDTVLHRSYLVK